MNGSPFTEITEMTKMRISECPLGRLSKSKAFDKPMCEYDMPLRTIYKNLNCPRENGRWEGERGNSRWIPDPNYIPPEKSRNLDKPYSNPDNLSWQKILEKYGIDGVPFKDGEPDFSEVSKGKVEVEPYTSDRDDNFDLADIELAKQKDCLPDEVKKWREENNYTWHECKDMKTMQKVPNEIHANITHSGGISESKKGT